MRYRERIKDIRAWKYSEVMNREHIYHYAVGCPKRPGLLSSCFLFPCWHAGSTEGKDKLCLYTVTVWKCLSALLHTVLCSSFNRMGHLGDVGQVHVRKMASASLSTAELHAFPKVKWRNVFNFPRKMGKKWWKRKFRHSTRRIQPKVHMEKYYGGPEKLHCLAHLKSAMLV